jgi:hypothetical protein
MDLLYQSAVALLEAGQSVALEANFYAKWDTPKQWLDIRGGSGENLQRVAGEFRDDDMRRQRS